MKPKVTDQAEVAVLKDFCEINGLVNVPGMNWIFTDDGHIEGGDGLELDDNGYLSRLRVDTASFKNSLNDKPKILDLRPLAGLVHLKALKLWLDNMICNDLNPLTALAKLRTLYLYGISFTDLSPLATLTELNELGIGYNDLHDLGPLSSLRDLRYLELTRTRAGDLIPLANLTNLNRLDLSCNQITDLAPLAELPHLTRLDLTGNRIQNVEALTNLNSLTRLTLDLNPINDPSPLVKLTSLKKLSLYGIEIKNQKLLKTLKTLNHLFEVKSFLVFKVFGYDVYALFLHGSTVPLLEFRKSYEFYRYKLHSNYPYVHECKPPVAVDKYIRDWIVSKYKDIKDVFISKFPKDEYFITLTEFYKVSTCGIYDVVLTPRGRKNMNCMLFVKGDEKYSCKIVRSDLIFEKPEPPLELQKMFHLWLIRNHRNITLCLGMLISGARPNYFNSK